MNTYSFTDALVGGIATVTVYTCFTLVFYALGAIVWQTYLRHDSSETTTPMPLGMALRAACREVLHDAPLRLHHSRMEVVRRNDERRADALAAAALRHPSSYQARVAAMAAHPSAQRAEAIAAMPTNTPATRAAAAAWSGADTGGDAA